VPQLRSRTISAGWTLSLGQSAGPHLAPPLPESVPATVPGTVHTDLLAAGLIPDPYLDENELTLDWIGHQRWHYRTVFDWTAGEHDHHDLVFAGLDTIATVLLNGTEIARTFNQHRSYRIPVAQLLQEGANDLEIIFDPAPEYAERQRDELGNLPNAYPAPVNFIRKMACNFGWDWGPALVTAGIWKPITLESWSQARLSRVRPVVTVVGTAGRVEVLVDLQSEGLADHTVAATVDGVRTQVDVPAGQTSAAVVIDVPDVALWWPHDLGPQPLSDLQVELLSPAGESLELVQQRIGFRTVTVDTSPDDKGSAFTFVVNGVPIFVRGANWIPDDCFPSRITKDRLAARIHQATDANLNMLRVWGGGIFESDDFYSLCDELGILVWQDFLFACAAYPEEEPLRGEVVAEARDNVARLMPHASLAMWNGGNENIWGYEDWGWKPMIGDRTWGSGYYLEILPEIVAEVDPGRVDLPGSPFSGSMGLHPNYDDHGVKHIWDVWNEVDYTTYASYVPRFVAEFGYQAPPTSATLYRSLSERPLSPGSAGMLHHQKAIGGNDKLRRGAAAHLPATENFDDWLYLMYVQQAEAVRFGIEHFRSHRGVCMGTIVWQLNDCWPVTSWAAVDGDGRKKLLWYALRDSCAPHLLTIQPRDGALVVFGVNDSDVSWRGDVTVQRMRFDGTVLASHSTRLVVDRLASRSVSLPESVASSEDPTAELLVARTPSGAVALHFFAADKDLRLPDPELQIDVRPAFDGTEIVVAATSLARHVALLADRISPSAVSDTALVTILPGTSHTFTVTGADPFTADDLANTGALRHLAAVVPSPTH
jgi:beta-mannosidase